MAGDDALRIDIQTIGGERAVKILTTLTDKVQEATTLLENTGWGNKEMNQLTKELKGVSDAMSAYAKATAEVNKTNQSAAMGEQKLANETNKTALSLAKLEMQKMKNVAAAGKLAAATAKAQAPYNRLRNEVNAYAQKMRDAIAVGKLNDTALAAMANKYSNLTGRLAEVDAKFKQLTNTIDQNKQQSMALASFYGNLASDVLQNLISATREFVGELSDAGVAMDGIKNTFAAGARGLKQGGDEMAYVADMANRLGLNLQSTYEPYAKFMTSFTRSGGTLVQSRQIFEDLSTAMVALHLPASRMENVFIALEQMANKGTVQSEELKRQLGNALPGAFELAAQSMNVTAGELMDLMKAGKVMSKDFLPNFAAVIKDSLGKQIGIAVDQYNAHLNRMQTQTFLIQANLGQTWNAAVTPAIQAWTGLLEVVNKVTKGWGENVVAITALQTAMVTLGVTTVATTIKFAAQSATMLALGKNIKAAVAAMWAFATTPVGAAITVVTAAVMGCVNAVNHANKEFEEMAVQQRDVTNNVVGLVSEFTQLAEIQNRTTAQQEAYNRNMQDLASRYPEILRYINEHGISMKTLTQDQADNIAKMAVQAEMMEAQKTLQAELSNGWLIFGTRAKQAAGILLLGLQGIGAGILHVVITLEQAITRTVAVAAKALGEVTEKAAFVASKVGAKELAVNLDNATKSMKGFAAAAWDVGKGQREYLNEGLKQTAYWIENMDFERQEKAMTRYRDTVATLGQEQQKLANTMMYSAGAITGLQSGGDGKDGKKGKKTKEPDSAWDILNKEIQKTEELIKVRLLNGQSIDDLEPKYARLKKQQTDINEAVDKLNRTPATGWERIRQELDKSAKTYQYMLANSQAYTAQEIENARQTYQNLNAEVKYQEVLKKREDILQITNREASKLADTLVDSLFDFDSELSVWDRFKDTALSAIKSVASAWIKEMGNSVLAGWQAGWSKNGSGNRLVSAILGAGSGFTGTPLEGTKDNPTYTGTGALNGAFGGIQKAWQSIKTKLGFGGTATGAAASIFGGEDISSGLSVLTNQANSLTSALTSATTPAVDGVVSSIGGVVSPASQAASSISSMALNAPMAAIGMSGMSASMLLLSPAAVKAAPALMQMGAALATITANASTAATAMAALAVATAAESVAKIPYVGGFLAPIAAGLTGAAIAAGAVMTGAGIAAGATIAGAGQMIGGGLSGIGNKLSGATNVVPHAKGGIVSSPTMFPMQGGNVGLAGEAGTEVIAPARRMANGDLGVGAVAPQVTINNYTNAAVEVKRRPDNSTEIKIAELNSMLASSRSNKGMAAAQSRMQKQGRQIG